MKCKKYCVALRLRLPNMRWQCESMAQMSFGCGKLWFCQRISTQWTHICCNGMLLLRNLHSVKLWKDPAVFDGTQMNTLKWITFKWFNGTRQIRWLNESFRLSIDAFCSLVYQLFLCHVIVFFVALSLCSFIRFIFEQSLKIVSPVVKFHAAASHWFCVSIMKASHSFCLTLIASKKYLNYTRFSLSRYRSIFFCLFIWITFKEH